ncbi:hypothetical protein GN956_G16969 [Arapaima gigas]
MAFRTLPHTEPTRGDNRDKALIPEVSRTKELVQHPDRKHRAHSCLRPNHPPHLTEHQQLQPGNRWHLVIVTDSLTRLHAGYDWSDSQDRA